MQRKIMMSRIKCEIEGVTSEIVVTIRRPSPIQEQFKNPFVAIERGGRDR